MIKEVIAKQLIKIAKELVTSDEDFGSYPLIRGVNRFYLNDKELENLGNEFLKTQFFSKIQSLIDKKFQNKDYQDAGFFAKPLYTYLKSKAVETIFKSFLKDQFKKKSKRSKYVDSDLEQFYKYGDFDLRSNKLKYPAIQKIMTKQIGNDWRKYIR